MKIDAQDQSLLDALLDSWGRHHSILLNLLRAIPQGGMEARAAADSPSVSQMFTHLHYVRMVSLFEEAPEFAGAVPGEEWTVEHDRVRIAEMLDESAARVRDAVRNRVETGRGLDLHFQHPILLFQFLIFHESYHHGQIKLALKLAGLAIPDREAGPLTWSVWRNRK